MERLPLFFSSSSSCTVAALHNRSGLLLSTGFLSHLAVMDIYWSPMVNVWTPTQQVVGQHRVEAVNYLPIKHICNSREAWKEVHIYVS